MAMKPSSKFERMKLKPSQDIAGKIVGMVKDVTINPLGTIAKTVTGPKKFVPGDLKARRDALNKRVKAQTNSLMKKAAK